MLANRKYLEEKFDAARVGMKSFMAALTTEFKVLMETLIGEDEIFAISMVSGESSSMNLGSVEEEVDSNNVTHGPAVSQDSAAKSKSKDKKVGKEPL